MSRVLNPSEKDHVAIFVIIVRGWRAFWNKFFVFNFEETGCAQVKKQIEETNTTIDKEQEWSEENGSLSINLVEKDQVAIFAIVVRGRRALWSEFFVFNFEETVCVKYKK